MTRAAQDAAIGALQGIAAWANQRRQREEHRAGQLQCDAMNEGHLLDDLAKATLLEQARDHYRAAVPFRDMEREALTRIQAIIKGKA